MQPWPSLNKSLQTSHSSSDATVHIFHAPLPIKPQSEAKRINAKIYPNSILEIRTEAKRRKKLARIHPAFRCHSSLSRMHNLREERPACHQWPRGIHEWNGNSRAQQRKNFFLFVLRSSFDSTSFCSLMTCFLPPSPRRILPSRNILLTNISGYIHFRYHVRLEGV